MMGFACDCGTSAATVVEVASAKSVDFGRRWAIWALPGKTDFFDRQDERLIRSLVRGNNLPRVVPVV